MSRRNKAKRKAGQNAGQRAAQEKNQEENKHGSRRLWPWLLLLPFAAAALSQALPQKQRSMEVKAAPSTQRQYALSTNEHQQYAPPAMIPSSPDGTGRSISGYFRSGGLSREPYELVHPDIAALVAEHAVVERTIPGNSGSFYLIGQEHACPYVTETGTHFSGSEEAPTLAPVQAEIFHTIMALRKQGVRLIVGEGIGARELEANPKWREKYLEHNDAVRFFRENPTELGYTLAKDVDDRGTGNNFILCGAGDDDLMQKLKQIDKESFEYDRMHLTPDIGRNPDRLSAWTQGHLRFNKEKDRLNKMRSSVYLRDSIALAQRYGQPSVVCVIGASHIEDIVREYERSKQNMAMHVLRPKSYKGKF